MTAVSTYNLFAANAEKTLERLSETPTVARQVEYYQENIGNVKSAEDLANDPQLLSFALKAFGLEEMSYARAFMQKVLEDEDFAEGLTDSRYQEFADTFDFKSFGSATTSFTAATDGVVDKFMQATLEEEAGTQNTGARLAIYFERKIGDIENAFEIMADRALYQVIQTAYALPEQLALLDINKQEDILLNRFDIEDFKDPEKVEEIKERFLHLWDVNNPTTVSVPPLIGFSGTQSLSLDLISTLQTLRR